ncbi:hypothetical protein KDN24_06350 [Bacillus sp. Bva_UNVM-123]|uniref:hypothetical protein n=1 Tax=Bacillus sp. Bva_UNVM-123 TaxID=2829798 RepID=UPI00391F6020
MIYVNFKKYFNVSNDDLVSEVKKMITQKNVEVSVNDYDSKVIFHFEYKAGCAPAKFQSYDQTNYLLEMVNTEKGYIVSSLTQLDGDKIIKTTNNFLTNQIDKKEKGERIKEFDKQKRNEQLEILICNFVESNELIEKVYNFIDKYSKVNDKLMELAYNKEEFEKALSYYLLVIE